MLFLTGPCGAAVSLVLGSAAQLRCHTVGQVIAELDEKKREALEITWNKVNGDFGSIFATLLPGTSAKLEPQEGHSFLDGAHLDP